MASRTKDLELDTPMMGSDKFLNDLFTMMKYMDNVTISDRVTHFSSTEIRLIGQILAFRYVGKRLISTQLAKLLGVTRSAVSQMVNRLEAEGILRRVPDEVDRKIAYIEVTEEMLGVYGEDLTACKEFITRVVRKYGVEKFNLMVGYYIEFFELLNTEKEGFVAKRKYKK